MQAARRLLLPHTVLLQGLSSIFQAVRYRKAPLMRVLLRLILRSALAHKSMRCVLCGWSSIYYVLMSRMCDSTHPLAREARFSLLLFGLQALRNCRLGTSAERKLREAIYASAFSWFAVRPQ